ncbi:hypothetical protein C3744_02470 [Priestia megaterium]|uniref:DUF4261 domain-containing protein n=1 Tax=Priestia megaterium TaxID=1404 RepID=A0A3D8X7N7_PRIMG|nr:DUF4261 domain-containing protein [Priestia megaterium]MDH3170582.1 DUF4261 domain-containing protein [Priestia megaterium]RDZ17777.1 hypothetical protein C3744_02470 [Priestia megaterium]
MRNVVSAQAASNWSKKVYEPFQKQIKPLLDAEIPTLRPQLQLSGVGEALPRQTCGMHNFGYKDLLTSTSNTNPAETVGLFQTFCLYTLIENPVFNSGETFSVDPKAPVFQLSAESCVLFESDDPFYNPYGVWRLNKIS